MMKQIQLNVVSQHSQMVHEHSLRELLWDALVLPDEARHLAEAFPTLEEPSSGLGERYALETRSKARRQTSTVERPDLLLGSPDGNGQKPGPTW